MRRLMLLAVFLSFAAALTAADAPTVGTWKLNIAKSKLPDSETANLQETSVTFREVDANTIEGVSTQILKDGKNNVTKWTTPKSGGLVTYQQGGMPPGVSIYSVLVDSMTMYNLYVVDNKQVFLMHIKFSPDFKTFTILAKGIGPLGQPIDMQSLYEKQ